MLPANMLRTTLCTTTRPIPLPSPNSFVVNPGSKMRSKSSARMPAPSSRTVSRNALPVNARPTRIGVGWPRLASAALRIRFTRTSYGPPPRGRAGGQVPAVQEGGAEGGHAGGEGPPAWALPSFGGWGRRAGAHRGDHPIPFAGADPDEAAPLYDVDAPVPQGCVDIQLAVMVAGGGVAGRLRLELGPRRHFPHGHRTAAQRHAGLA